MFCNVCQGQENQKVGKDDHGGLERIKGRNKCETSGVLYGINALKYRKQQENKEGANEKCKTSVRKYVNRRPQIGGK